MIEEHNLTLEYPHSVGQIRKEKRSNEDKFSEHRAMTPGGRQSIRYVKEGKGDDCSTESDDDEPFRPQDPEPAKKKAKIQRIKLPPDTPKVHLKAYREGTTTTLVVPICSFFECTYHSQPPFLVVSYHLTISSIFSNINFTLFLSLF